MAACNPSRQKAEGPGGGLAQVLDQPGLQWGAVSSAEMNGLMMTKMTYFFWFVTHLLKGHTLILPPRVRDTS